MGKDNFILYSEQEQLLEDLNDAQAGRLFKAIFEYERTLVVPKLNQIENLVFKSFKITLDRNRQKYEKVVERNKANGKKGGRPKTQNNPNNPSGFFENPKEPKKADNDNEQDKEQDNDNDVDIVLSELVKYYEDNIGLLNTSLAPALIELRDKFPKEFIIRAIDISCENNVRNMRYIKAILDSWEKKGFKTLGDIENEKQNKKQKKEINLDEVWSE